MLLKEIRNIFRTELSELYPQEEIDSIFHLLVAHHLGLERFVLAMQPNLNVSKEAEQPLFEALAQLRSGRPVQYVIGKTEFMDLEFQVNEHVLIPRPETEELVRWMLDYLVEPVTNETLRILDIGTGSGCIAVSLAKNLPDAVVYGCDISKTALLVAGENAKANNTQVYFEEIDILDMTAEGINQCDISVFSNTSGSKSDASPKSEACPKSKVSLKSEASPKPKASPADLTIAFDKFDVIVSNPPYVRKKEKRDMQKNVTDHEPEQALFVSDENPLKFYSAIARFASKNLNPGGSLFLEINQYMSQETVRLLQDSGFSNVELRKDMFGNDRMIKCTLADR